MLGIVHDCEICHIGYNVLDLGHAAVAAEVPAALFAADILVHAVLS